LRPQSVEIGAIPEALQSNAIANLRGQLGSALAREADAQTLYGPQHPLFISAQAQVRDARRQIADELARIVQAGRAELDRARSAEQSLSQSVERLKRETLTSGAAAVQLRELEREADANRQVYQSFLLRARETGELTNVDTTNARVITTAVAPLEKAGPNRKAFALIGLIAGLALGAVLAALWELGRMARRSNAAAVAAAGDTPSNEPAQPAEASRATRDSSREDTPANERREPATATQPRFVSRAPEARTTDLRTADARTSEAPSQPAPRAGGPRFGRWRGADTARQPELDRSRILHVRLPRARKHDDRAAALANASAFHGTAFPTESWDAPRSAFGAAVQSIRDRLALEETAAGNRKTVVIGLQPGAGASLVALSLTLAAAREKATPLLIDLAGGPASLSAVFGDGAALGAEDVISGRVGLIRAALQDDETGAFFLPRPSGGERLPSPCPGRLKSGLFDQTRRFESVVTDAGAVSDGALPHLLAELADDIVLVTSASLSTAEAERMAKRALGADMDKVRVIAANEASP
jgi:hypothetical protein